MVAFENTAAFQDYCVDEGSFGCVPDWDADGSYTLPRYFLQDEPCTETDAPNSCVALPYGLCEGINDLPRTLVDPPRRRRTWNDYIIGEYDSQAGDGPFGCRIERTPPLEDFLSDVAWETTIVLRRVPEDDGLHLDVHLWRYGAYYLDGHPELGYFFYDRYARLRWCAHLHDGRTCDGTVIDLGEPCFGFDHDAFQNIDPLPAVTCIVTL